MIQSRAVTDPTALRQAARELRENPASPPYAEAFARWLEHFANTEYDPHADIVETDMRHEKAMDAARAVLGTPDQT